MIIFRKIKRNSSFVIPHLLFNNLESNKKMDLFDKTPEKRGSINIELPSTVKKAATLVS